MLPCTKATSTQLLAPLKLLLRQSARERSNFGPSLPLLVGEDRRGASRDFLIGIYDLARKIRLEGGARRPCARMRPSIALHIPGQASLLDRTYSSSNALLKNAADSLGESAAARRWSNSTS
jgi:hypothetical protein